MNDLIDLCIDLYVKLSAPMVQFGFIVVICYLTFRDRLKRSAVRIVVEMFFYFSALALVFLLLVFFGYEKGWIVGASALFLLAFFHHYVKTVREDLQKLLFVFCVAFHMSSCMELIIDMLSTFLGVQENSIIDVLIGIVVYVPGGWAVYRCLAPRLRQSRTRGMKWLWTVPAVFYFISECFFTVGYHKKMYAIKPVYPAVFLIFLTSSFAVCVLLLRILDSVAENVRLESEAAAVNRQLDLQLDQYGRLMENAETMKSMHHDIRHHLAVIGQLAETENAGKVKRYAEDLLGRLVPAQEKTYCENYFVDAVAAHYLGLAESEGATVEARFDVPEDTGLVPAMDLCVIIGNFLENALEACRRVERGKGFIRVRTRIAGDTLSIVVTNSFDGLWECDKNGAYLSRKKTSPQREGVGLSSVKAVCVKHRGLVQYEITGDVWKSSALVHMEQQSSILSP